MTRLTSILTGGTICFIKVPTNNDLIHFDTKFTAIFFHCFLFYKEIKTGDREMIQKWC